MQRQKIIETVECSFCKKEFEPCHRQESYLKRGLHVYCSPECQRRIHLKNPNFVGKKLIEKPAKTVQIIKLEEQEEEENRPLRVRCLECGRVFTYPEASPEIKELIWFCSEKCRERYHMKHYKRDALELEM
jgi:ribosomal protein L24E